MYPNSACDLLVDWIPINLLPIPALHGQTQYKAPSQIYQSQLIQMGLFVLKLKKFFLQIYKLKRGKRGQVLQRYF